MPRGFLYLLIASLSLATITARAGEPATLGSWPHRRGPTHDGHAHGEHLRDAWPDEGPVVLWHREIGQGYSGVTVDGPRVYTQTQTLSGQRIVCLDATTGETIWEDRYAPPYLPFELYPGPRSTPTLAEGRVVGVGPKGVVRCLDATTGDLLWTVDLDARFGLRGVGFGYAASPTVVDGVVFLPVGAEGAGVVALDLASGDVVWQAGNEPASYCDILPITWGDRPCLVALLENAWSVHDRRTGEVLCNEVFSRGYNEHAAAPLYFEGDLVLMQAFRAGAECIRLEAASDGGAAIAPRTLWLERRLSADTASAVRVGGYIYGFGLRDVQAKLQRPSRGEFLCVEWATGRIAWESDRPGHSTVVAADGKLVLFNDSGELILAKASPDGYEELARAAVFPDEICWTAPAVCDGRVYLRSPTRLACIDIGEEASDASSSQGKPTRTGDLPRATWRLRVEDLLGGEKPYMMDPATVEELRRWLVWSVLGVIAPVGLLAMVVAFGERRLRPEGPCRIAIGLFDALLIVGGFSAGAVLHRFLPPFLFTWPVALAAAQHIALKASFAAKGTDKRTAARRGRWAIALLIAVFGLYFVGCKSRGMSVEWIALLAPLPSWPIAVPAALLAVRRPSVVREIACFTVSFIAFFAVVAVLTRLRAAM